MLVKNVATIVRTKILTKQLDKTNYISTDNMLPNYAGITTASNVPSGTATQYSKDDILLSNIRPYFKKVWFTDRNGGCNPDIICIRVSNERCIPQYLYYQLITDNFTNNYVKACKGAKMPRGDLNQLLEYDFYCPPYEEQLRITNILGSIDKKIEINKKKIEKLEAIAQEIYNYWFVQYDFPDENGKPYKSNGGQLVWNDELKREIPVGWTTANIGLFCELVRGISYDRYEVRTSINDSSVMLVKSNNIESPYINFDDAIYVPLKNVSTNQYLKNGDIVITMSSGSKNHMGKMGLFYHKSNCTFGAFCAKISVLNADHYEYIVNCLFNKLFKNHLNTQTTGTSINNICNEQILAYQIPLPKLNIIKRFHKIVGNYYKAICSLFLQNYNLILHKNNLLPLLMNGQVTVI